MLQQAIVLHQSGRLAEAAALYREVLAANPENPDALNLLGVLETQRGNSLEGLRLIGRAIALTGGNANFFFAQGYALQNLGRFGEALASYDRALAIKPRAHDVLMNRGNALCALGRFAEALESYERALDIKPGYAEALSGRGVALHALGRLGDALASYNQVLAAKPDYADALNNRGNLLQDLRRYGEALADFERALAVKPDYTDALVNRSNVLKDMKRYDEALAGYERALALEPDSAKALANRGAVLHDLGRYSEALASCDAALKVRPDHPEALVNRASSLRELNRFEDALASYEKALAADPGFVEARCGRGTCLLTLGRMPEGWADYEHRWRLHDFPSRRPALDAPHWTGENLNGRSILVYDEQGLGDTIQFSRYLPLLAARGAQVGFLVRSKLGALLRSLPGGVRILSAPDARYDFQCALMSLPHLLRTDIASIPAPERYLAAEPSSAAQWRERLGEGSFRIGVSWQGNPAGRIDAGRSFPLHLLAPLARLPGVRLISLQKNHGLEQLAQLPAGMKVEIPGEDFDAGADAFADTAAVMENLDLVVTADTAIAHLAGALGRPVWVALKYVSDWRWMLDRADSPWYPSMRLFRQPAPDDWNTVFRNIAAEQPTLLDARTA